MKMGAGYMNCDFIKVELIIVNISLLCEFKRIKSF